VDAFWQAGIDAGYRDDGAPGPRAVYGPDYYGGFLLDPDGNSAEAVHTEREDPVPDGCVDHLWIRVRDPAAYYGAFVLDPDGRNVEVVNHNGWRSKPGPPVV
jgi:hypothetical protein